MHTGSARLIAILSWSSVTSVTVHRTVSISTIHDAVIAQVETVSVQQARTVNGSRKVEERKRFWPRRTWKSRNHDGSLVEALRKPYVHGSRTIRVCLKILRFSSFIFKDAQKDLKLRIFLIDILYFKFSWSIRSKFFLLLLLFFILWIIFTLSLSLMPLFNVIQFKYRLTN